MEFIECNLNLIITYLREAKIDLETRINLRLSAISAGNIQLKYDKI